MPLIGNLLLENALLQGLLVMAMCFWDKNYDPYPKLEVIE